jgi:hypothetical protein
LASIFSFSLLSEKYVCDFCPKSFHKKSNYVDHVRIHTGEKPFICRVCQRAFTQKSHLKSHSIIHMAGNDKSNYWSFIDTILLWSTLIRWELSFWATDNVFVSFMILERISIFMRCSTFSEPILKLHDVFVG